MFNYCFELQIYSHNDTRLQITDWHSIIYWVFWNDIVCTSIIYTNFHHSLHPCHTAPKWILCEIRFSFSLSLCMTSLRWGMFLICCVRKVYDLHTSAVTLLTLTFDPWLFAGSQRPSGISLPNTFASQIQTLQDIGQTPPTKLITFLFSSSFSLFLFSLFSLCIQFSCFPVCLLHCYFALPVSFSHNKEKISCHVRSGFSMRYCHTSNI